jgi:hypothetical protein
MKAFPLKEIEKLPASTAYPSVNACDENEMNASCSGREHSTMFWVRKENRFRTNELPGGIYKRIYPSSGTYNIGSMQSLQCSRIKNNRRSLRLVKMLSIHVPNSIICFLFKPQHSYGQYLGHLFYHNLHVLAFLPVYRLKFSFFAHTRNVTIKPRQERSSE